MTTDTYSRATLYRRRKEVLGAAASSAVLAEGRLAAEGESPHKVRLTEGGGVSIYRLAGAGRAGAPALVGYALWDVAAGYWGDIPRWPAVACVPGLVEAVEDACWQQWPPEGEDA